MNDDIKCPYCGKEQEICHDDGYGMEEDRMHEQECRGCEKTFGYKTSIVLYYDAHAIPCMDADNKGDKSRHSWKLTKTFPKEFSQMECAVCEKRRPMTEEERISNKIGTVEEYFKYLDSQRQKG